MRAIAPINILLPVFCLGAIAGYFLGDVRTGALVGFVLGLIFAAIGGSEPLIVD